MSALAFLDSGSQPAYLCLISEAITPSHANTIIIAMQPSLHPQECIYPSARTACTAEKQSLNKPKTQKRPCAAHSQMSEWCKKCNWRASILAGEYVDSGVAVAARLHSSASAATHTCPGLPISSLQRLAQSHLVAVPLQIGPNGGCDELYRPEMEAIPPPRGPWCGR